MRSTEVHKLRSRNAVDIYCTLQYIYYFTKLRDYVDKSNVMSDRSHKYQTKMCYTLIILIINGGRNVATAEKVAYTVFREIIKYCDTLTQVSFTIVNRCSAQCSVENKRQRSSYFPTYWPILQNIITGTFSKKFAK